MGAQSKPAAGLIPTVSLATVLAGALRRRGALILTGIVALVLWLYLEARRAARAIPRPKLVPTLEARGLRKGFEYLANMRSVGGMRGAGGAVVRHGILFRSGRLNPLSEADRAHLGELGLRLIADFRSVQEVRHKPDILPDGFAGECVHYDVNDGDLMRLVRNIIRSRGNDKREQMRSLMMTVMCNCATKHQATYAQFIRALAQPTGTPALCHCTAGKDRTGWATALVLFALGVDEADIMADYMVSNALWYKTAKNYAVFVRFASYFRATGEDAAPALQVDEAYIRAALDAVRARWGTMDAYLRAPDGLGLDEGTLGALRSKFLVQQ